MTPADEWAELEALAKAATPGPWEVAEDNNPFADGRHVFAKGLDGTQFVVANMKTDRTFVTATNRVQQQRNALFSAAADPATILKLIEAARQSDGGGGDAVVPREPTEAMMNAGEEAHDNGGWRDGCNALHIYRAMIAAAPHQATSTAGGK